jgi:4-aminobutyrate aminotransferase
VLDILREQSLAEGARQLGAQFLDGLGRLASRHPVIGDVRGRGLLIGIEIVRDAARTPDPALAKRIELETVKHGALISTTGVHGNTLRITPPLVINSGQVERALGILDTVLRKLAPA